MHSVEHFGKLYAEQGPAGAHRYCATQRLIGSVCMCCGRAYGLVESLSQGGGLSHGWCSEACSRIGAQRAGVATKALLTSPH